MNVVVDDENSRWAIFIITDAQWIRQICVLHLTGDFLDATTHIEFLFLCRGEIINAKWVSFEGRISGKTKNGSHMVVIN